MENVNASFINDKEKMKDFYTLSKEEFLKSYSYINEASYNLTKLETIKESIKNENISYGEIVELQGLVDYINKNDVELLEWAGACESCRQQNCDCEK